MVVVALSACAVSVLNRVIVTVLVIVSVFLSVSDSVTMCISVSVRVSVLELLLLYDRLVLKLSLPLVNIRPLSTSQLFVLSFGYFQFNTISVIVVGLSFGYSQLNSVF